MVEGEVSMPKPLAVCATNPSPYAAHDPSKGTASDVTRMQDSLRGAIAGGVAAELMASSIALFEAGGSRLLSAGSQSALRRVAERGAVGAFSAEGVASVALLGAKARTLMASRLWGLGPSHTATRAFVVLANAAGRDAARAASKEVLRGVGKGAGIGFVLDGAVAGVEAFMRVNNGTYDARTAVKHVAKEATTGALATGAGVLLGAALVALTGGMATPVVFAVSATSALGAKRLLRHLLR